MDLRQLEAFLAVAEERHFGRAATRLHMAQPPLSRHIRRLEDDVGAQLLRRTSRGVELTPAGSAFLDEARATLSQAERAARVAQRVARGETGRLRVGHIDSASSEILPGALRAFHERYPKVRIVLEESKSAPLIDAVHQGHLDVAFVRPPVTEDSLTSEALVDEPLVAVLPADHPLGDRKRLPLERLAGECFIVVPRHENAALRDEITAACQRAGFDPNIADEALTVSSVVLLVAAGLGVSLVPVFLSRQLCQRNVVYHVLEGHRGGVQLSLTWRSNEASAAVHGFADLAREAARTLQS